MEEAEKEHTFLHAKHCSLSTTSEVCLFLIYGRIQRDFPHSCMSILFPRWLISMQEIAFAHLLDLIWIFNCWHFFVVVIYARLYPTPGLICQDVDVKHCFFSLFCSDHFFTIKCKARCRYRYMMIYVVQKGKWARMCFFLELQWPPEDPWHTEVCYMYVQMNWWIDDISLGLVCQPNWIFRAN